MPSDLGVSAAVVGMAAGVGPLSLPDLLQASQASTQTYYYSRAVRIDFGKSCADTGVGEGG